MGELFNVYIKFWLEFWLSNDTKAFLSEKWRDRKHPSIVPSDKFR